MRSVSIIGIGRLGGALAIALTKAGFSVENLVHRDGTIAHSISGQLLPHTRLVPWVQTPAKIASDIIVISTADPEINGVAEALKGRLESGAVVLHTSGSLSSAVLDVLSKDGHPAASMHPLVSVSDASNGAGHFANAYFCVEGNQAATDVARSIVSALGGHSFTIEPGHKALYHAAAVVASGHLVALIDISIDMLVACGIERDAARQILFPLIATTLRNLETKTPSSALTGSFARTDIAAIRRHLDSLDNAGMPAALRNIYLSLGERSLDLAESNGASPADVAALREVISIAKRKAG